MLYINKITNNAYQQMELTGLAGIVINISMRYLPRMRLWVMNVAYNDFAANGVIVNSSPNILRCFKNVLPFGISCVTKNGLDPFNVTDFQDQSADLFLLDATDVAALEKALY